MVTSKRVQTHMFTLQFALVQLLSLTLLPKRLTLGALLSQNRLLCIRHPPTAKLMTPTREILQWYPMLKLSPVVEQGSDKEGHESEKEEGAKPAKKFSNPPRLGLTDSELKAIAERMHEEKNRKRSLKRRRAIMAQQFLKILGMRKSDCY